MKRHTLTPAESVGRFLSPSKLSNDRIPLSAFFGVVAVVAVLVLLMCVGAAVSF